MKSDIFVEGSNTTADDPKLQLKEYYKGSFRVVSGLYDDLEEFTNTNMHVLSEEYGVAEGHEQALERINSSQESTGTDKMVRSAKKELLNAATNADVMVILLSTDLFQATVVEVWDKIVETAKPNSIWCFSAAQSALTKLDFKELETKGCTVFTYQRVGVARIGTETREELLETVKQNAIK